MKKPEVSTHDSDPDLVGSEGQSSWVHGRNCVYRDGSLAQYRVSIKTSTDWKSFGDFNDLEVASYVANVAILTEGCKKKYKLNKVGNKDHNELKAWRTRGQNSLLEQKARDKYSQFQIEQEQEQTEERCQQQQLAKELQMAQAKGEAQKRERDAKEAALIAEEQTAVLLDLLQRDLSGEQHRKIRSELDKRRGTRHAT